MAIAPNERILAADVVATATPNKIALRDAAARAKFAAPAAAGDALIKGTPLTITEMAPLTTGKVWQGVANRPSEVDMPAPPAIVRKTADKTLNDVAVLENDDHLLLLIGANEVWQIDLFVLCQGNDTADIDFGFSYPVGCLIKWGSIGAGNDISSNSWGYAINTKSPRLKLETEHQAVGINAAYVTGYRFSLIVINGANAGNVNLQWAQDTATVANTTVLENSCLIAHQLA